MDTNEIIALSIVVLAAFLALRCFLDQKGGGCCGSGCAPVNKQKLGKKSKTLKSEDPKNQ